MKFRVRLMKPSDRRVWAAMRARLWPEHPAEELDSEMDTLLAEGDFWTFIAEEADGTPAGFAEFSIRKFANGCTSRPVPFLEGIWIEPDYRRQGAGRALIEHAGTFFGERGFRELGSDAKLENTASHHAHQGWGFCETERVVYFRKLLDSPAGRDT